MTKPTIAVCTPTFHRPEAVKIAMDSVLGQTYANVEHWIVKDGCTQGPDCPVCAATDALGAEYNRKDARIHYVSLPRHMGGFGYYSRNYGIEHSTTPLIAYLDDDNWWEPEHLETLYDALTRADAGFAFSGTIVRRADGTPVMHRISRKPYFSGIDTNELLHRRELIDRYGAWKPTDAVKHNHDWELVCRWMQGHERYVATSLATSNYKLSPRDPVLRFWYSYYKHRFLRAFSSVLISDARYYRAETLSANS